MNKFQPIFNLINTIVLKQLQLSLCSVGEQAIGLSTEIEQILLKTEMADGLSLNQIQVKLAKLQLPHADDLNLYVNLLIENLDISILPPFWARAATLAKNPLIARCGILLDCIELRNLRLKVTLSPTKVADIEISLESCRLKLINQLMQETSNLKLAIYNFNLLQKDKKIALKAATIRVEDVQIRVFETMVNRVTEVVQDKIPSMVSEIGIAFIDDTMRIDARAKLGPLPVMVPVELQLNTQENLLGIYIKKVFVGWVRPIINKGLQKVTAKRPEISVYGDYIWIDPWLKIPFQPQLKIDRFTIENGALLIGLGSLPEPEYHLNVASQPASSSEPTQISKAPEEAPPQVEA